MCGQSTEEGLPSMNLYPTYHGLSFLNSGLDPSALSVHQCIYIELYKTVDN
jgi:hypothetical protein